MTDMIEKVARAIHVSSSLCGDQWDRLAALDRQPYFKNAYAAIKAMQEPTDGMINAGCKAVDEALVVGYTDLDCQVIHAFEAMIKAASGKTEQVKHD